MHEVPLLCNQEGKGDSSSRMSHSPHSCPRRIVVLKTKNGDRWSHDATPTKSGGSGGGVTARLGVGWDPGV